MLRRRWLVVIGVCAATLVVALILLQRDASRVDAASDPAPEMQVAVERSPQPAQRPVATDRAPAAHAPQVAARRDDEDAARLAAARVGERQDDDGAARAAAARVLEELDGLFTASALEGVSAHSEADDIVIVAPAGKCDVSLLRELANTLVSFQLDPGRSFRALRCANGGTMVTLK